MYSLSMPSFVLPEAGVNCKAQSINNEIGDSVSSNEREKSQKNNLKTHSKWKYTKSSMREKVTEDIKNES